MRRRLIRTLGVIGTCGVLFAASAAAGQTADGAGLSVSIVSMSGYRGHAFVYAQVSDSSAAYPAPTGTGHLSPYYARWVGQPFQSPGCPWIWLVYVFDRATGRQVNGLPPGTPQPNLGTTTTLCASPSATPVQEPPVADASARLDLDLAVSLTPSRPLAASPAVLTALLSGTLTQDLNLYLNIAIKDWTVGHWVVDFGDSFGVTIGGQAGNQLNVPHTYAAAGTFDARALAAIVGNAQGAQYDRYGRAHLVDQPFSVEVANDVTATARPAAIKEYVPPDGVVAVSPSFGSAAAASPAFRSVDVLRGALSNFLVRFLISREGSIRLESAQVGTAKSRLLSWRYDGSASDAPAGFGTRPGQLGGPTDSLRLQWNQPDRLAGTQMKEYLVPVTLYVETRFSDAHRAIYAISSSFSVSVDFAAESG